MRRIIPYQRTAGAMPRRRLRPGEITHAVRSRIPTPGEASERRVLSLDGRKANLDNSLDKMLSTAVLGRGKELASMLRRVDQFSKASKSDTVGTQTLSDALQRTVTCAVKQSLLDRELRSLALTDDLTGLYNRRAFLALAGQQLRVSRRKSQGLLLFFADVDNLKIINDSHGHREGDLALVRVADSLQRTFRDSDVIARLGGDEFVVLALETSSENREVILRRLGRALKVSNADESRYELSLSVGMARFDPRHPVTLGKLIATADETMYEEKKGRSRIAVT
jgi:diguanylate cyclase (GGDEF)-like protein